MERQTYLRKAFLFGFMMHILVTLRSHPVEFFLTPGSERDTSGELLYDFK
jgi:hypothetical protein